MLPTEAPIRALLKTIAPASILLALLPIGGDHYNAAYRIEAQSATGATMSMVLKGYAECGSDLVQKARLEFQTLTWLQQQGIPVPTPLYIDEAGTLLGAPAIITNFMAGTQIWHATEHPVGVTAWIHKMATTLAQIHRIPCDREVQAFLRSGDPQATWFLNYGVMPERMKADPDGEAVWQTTWQQLPHLQRVQSTLVHIDYWRGNLLWHQGQIAAVIDWEEASYGDPGQDVAYCRMDLWVTGFEAAADEFLQIYETQIGRPVANLGFWELVAAARPIWRPEGWFTQPGEQARFRQFVANALRRTIDAR